MISAGAWVVLLGLTVSPPRPNAALSPAEVIRTVAAALQNNNSPMPNAGIFTAYQFASPGNRAATGPYGRFFRIVKSGDSAPLFGKRAQEFGEIIIHGDKAEQDCPHIPVHSLAAERRAVRRVLDGGRRCARALAGECVPTVLVRKINYLA
jgi:hypothetical protein